MLQVQGLSAGYGAIRVLHEVSFTVGPGQIVALVGPNGAGKTTLMSCLAGLHAASAGAVLLDGRQVTNLPAERLVRMGISLVPEGRQVFAPLTVRENLFLGGFHSSPWQTRSLREGLTRVLSLFPQLERLMDRAAGALSGGEQQMLAIGRALMSSPRYLLLDEASLGLAPLVVRKILATLQLLRSELNLGVLLVEQNARAALQVADHVVVLEGGRVVLAGPPDEVGRSAAMQDAYLGRGVS